MKDVSTCSVSERCLGLMLYFVLIFNMYFNVICNEACEYLYCVITFFETDGIFTYILFLYLHGLQCDLQ